MSKPDYPYKPVPFTSVRIEDAFWAPRVETNRVVTVPTLLRRCEETGRVDNFAKAARLMEGPFAGKFYDDSDVYKAIEAAAYSLNVHPDPELDAHLDKLIALIGAAQEPDGYLYTARTIDPDHVPDRVGPTRWSNLRHNHELYNVGHLYEAATAHYQATGKRSLLDIAIKNADLIDQVFGPGKRRDVPGHEEIEIGLIKLYRVTGEQRYLNLAKFFVDERGRADGHELYGAYAQDHLPVVEQNEAVGHAVRAGYLYSGVADVAALTGDEAYVEALERIWKNIVSKKLYLTGGVGARRQGEAFGDNYELPNAIAYNETCAAIASMLFNYRMFLLHGDARYLDVFERTLYNGFLSGVSLSGDLFFYPNPLESDGKFDFNRGTLGRQPWFSTSCCPMNVARLVASLGGYVYAVKDSDIYVNLYVGGAAQVEAGGQQVSLTQETRYPWDGRVRITVSPERPGEMTLRLRLPGWARGETVPSDLYTYLPTAESAAISLTVNGEMVGLHEANGFAVVRRTWQTGDVVELALSMPVRQAIAHPLVADDAGKVAIERGPIVYCAEWPDNKGSVFDLCLSDIEGLAARHDPALLGGVTVIEGPSATLIPYYAWSNRGVGEMAVWLKRDCG